MVMLVILVLLFIIAHTVFSVIRNYVPQGDEKINVYSSPFYGYSSKEIRKKLSTIKLIVYCILIALTVFFTLFTSIFSTTEQDIGFTETFGITSQIEGSGMHFKIPFFSHKYIYDATTKGMPIGYIEGSNETQEEDSLMITSDFNFVNIDFYLEYRIIDPIEYHYGSNKPEAILKNIAQSAIRNTVGQYDVDSVMTVGKSEIEAKVFEDIIEELTHHHTGLQVVNVTIQDAEPPTTAVAAAFKDVENAKQNAETEINNAYKYENTEIPAAEAESEAVKQAANAAKTERVNQAKEEVANFEALFEEYQNNPDTVKQRLYYEALEEILPNMEIIISKDSKMIYVKDGSVVGGK